LLQRLGTPIRQKVNQAVSLQVYEDGSIRLATAKAPVVDAQDAWSWYGGKYRLTHQTKQAGATGSAAAQSDLVNHPLAGPSTQREAQAFQEATQGWRAPLIDRSDAGQAFPKRPARTGDVATVKPPCGDP
jgi:hypothetical protein